jgi:hypothetical protein
MTSCWLPPGKWTLQCSTNEWRRPLSQVRVFIAQQDTSKARGAVGIAHCILSVGRAAIMRGAVALRATVRGKQERGECRKRSKPNGGGEIKRGAYYADHLTCLFSLTGQTETTPCSRAASAGVAPARRWMPATPGCPRRRGGARASPAWRRGTSAPRPPGR